MNGGRLFSVRGGRVVAVGRAILALFLVAAHLLGPKTTSAFDEAVRYRDEYRKQHPPKR